MKKSNIDKRFRNIFSGVKKRCDNQNHSSYLNYGAKGIKYFWNSLDEFVKDMYLSYLDHVKEYGEDDTQLDRIDNSGHYHKDNCRWVTRKENCNNKGVVFRLHK